MGVTFCFRQGSRDGCLLNNLNLNKMDSDDDGFAKQGGEALDLGEDFDSEEEVDDDPAPP